MTAMGRVRHFRDSGAALYELPTAEAKLRATILLMAGLILRYAELPLTSRIALLVIRNSGAAPRDELAEAAAVQRFVQSLPFRNDATDVERLASPVQSILSGAGDCDCQTILASSLLRALGRTTALRIVDEGNGWSHVYTVALLKGPNGRRWTPVETVRPAPLGFESPLATRAKTFTF